MTSTIQRVSILGAGAMGAYFASRFYDSPGFSTNLIARGERLQKLKQDGLVINGSHYLIPAISPDEAEAPADLILVALKHHHLAEAVHDLKKLVGPSTLFISVMNGLESEEYIGSVYGMDKVLYAISLGIDAVRVDNQVTYTKPGTHYFGEAQNLSLSPRVLRAQESFARAGIQYETPQDMMRMMWWKFMINVGTNQASAVMRAPYHAFQTDPDAQALMESLMQEVLSLAKAAHVNLVEEDIKNWYPVLNRLSPQGKTSMLQDIEAGRKTEVEIFAGKVISLGKTYGIPTPVNQAIFQIIRILEKNY
jgi:2-dehydropantoate 2-reductase